MREMNNSNSTAHSKAQNKDRNDFGRNEDLVIIDNDLLTRFKGRINTRDRSQEDYEKKELPQASRLLQSTIYEKQNQL